MIDEITIYAPEADFVMPYLRRALPGVTITGTDDAHAPALAVMLSSAFSPRTEHEKVFTDFCADRNIPCTILRCGDIVGTGMTGFPRALAEAIYRGRFFHFPGNEARRSVIHATALAATVASIAAKASADVAPDLPAVMNLHDGSNPTIDELADALAYRIQNKRISNLSLPFQQWVARRLYGPDTYTLYTTTQTIENGPSAAYLPEDTVPVCEYLRTHTYDDSSL